MMGELQAQINLALTLAALALLPWVGYILAKVGNATESWWNDLKEREYNRGYSDGDWDARKELRSEIRALKENLRCAQESVTDAWGMGYRSCAKVHDIELEDDEVDMRSKGFSAPDEEPYNERSPAPDSPGTFGGDSVVRRMAQGGLSGVSKRGSPLGGWYS